MGSSPTSLMSAVSLDAALRSRNGSLWSRPSSSLRRRHIQLVQRHARAYLLARINLYKGGDWHVEDLCDFRKSAEGGISLAPFEFLVVAIADAPCRYLLLGETGGPSCLAEIVSELL